VQTYLNDTLVESKSNFELVGLNTVDANRQTIGFITTQEFDEVRLVQLMGLQ
jgi:hypothetical protein